MVDASSTFTIEVEVDASNAQRSYANFTSQLRNSTSGLDTEINKIEKGLGGAAQQQQKFQQSLSTTRYALYDVSSTLTIAGAAMLGLSVATAAVAIAWERDFAQVIRTTGVTGDAVQVLRDDLVELAQTMPVAFGDITSIATLAGQLGVAEDRVASFTQTVAKFTAVTDLTAEASATAFGRLDALLPDVQGNYEALGSSIAKVGVNSVATESQIVNISTQISSMGSFAGLTAAEVVGLSGALASIGGQPELSRGTVTRVFTQMSKAIAESGENLDKFAKVAGVSSEEFASSFGTNKFGPVFQSFIEGLSDVTRNGGDATAALRELGISSVRDVPLLLRLATASNSAGVANKLLAQTINDANDGFRSGTELNRQYGIIANTTAAKLEILVTNFQALLDALGSGALGPLSAILDWAVQFLQRMTDLTKSPVGQWVGGLTLALTGLIGVLALVAGALIAGYAGIVAMQQALAGLTGSTTVASVGLKGLTVQLAATGTAGKVAATALKGLGVAMKALSVIGIALILPDIATWATDVVQGSRNVDQTLGANIKNIKEALEAPSDDQLTGWGEFGAAINRAFAGADPAEGSILRSIKQTDEALTEMIGSGKAVQAREQFNDLKSQWLDSGRSLGTFNTYFTDTNNALKAYDAAASSSTGTTEALASEQEQAALRAENLATALGLVPTELAALEEGLATGSAQFFDFGDMIQRVQDKTRGWAEEQSEKVYDSKDSWQEFYDGASVNLQDFIAVLDGQIAAQSVWAQNLQTLSAQGATAFVTELARMGPEGAPLAAAAVNATAEELMKLEEQARLAAFLSSEAFAQGFTENTPILMEAYSQSGLEAVQALISAQVSGAPGAVQEVITAYNLQLSGNPMALQATSRDAVNETQRFLNYVAAQRPTVRIIATYETHGAPALPAEQYSIFRRAQGGPIYGPGSSTSDSIPAYLSNGEFVMKAAAVQKYGNAFMHAINSGRVPKFAGGGSVSASASSGGSTMMGGVIELGPKSLSRLSQSVQNNIMLDDAAISRAAERGNAKRRSAGELR